MKPDPTPAGRPPQARDRRPIRLLLVASDLGPGGSERQQLALARRLPRDRFQPLIAVMRERGMNAEAAEADGITVINLELPQPAMVHPLRFAVAALRASVRYVRLARRHRFDIVDAWLYHASWLVAICRPFAGVPTIVMGRRSLSDYKAQWSWPRRFVDRIIARQARVIVANSDAVRRSAIDLERIDPRRIVTIRNGVEVPPEAAAAQRHAVRSSWGVADDAFVIGAVANLKPGKGIEDLLDAVARLVPPDDTRLVLVGQGSARDRLVRRAQDLGIAHRVVFHGVEPDPPALLCGFDLFVHPSHAEGLPNAVLEAAAAGLPVVATEAGGTPEIILDGQTGRCVPIGDVVALAGAIDVLRADPVLRRRFGTAAREHARRAFAMDRFVAESADLYERLVADD